MTELHRLGHSGAAAAPASPQSVKTAIEPKLVAAVFMGPRLREDDDLQFALGVF
jgi:hypothetical protein